MKNYKKVLLGILISILITIIMMSCIIIFSVNAKLLIKDAIIEIQNNQTNCTGVK